VAGRELRNEYADHAPTTTALVHELYLKLVDQAQIDWHSRAHFFTIAARAMRQILVDHARKRKAKKRGGDWQRTTLVDHLLASEAQWDDLLALDEALDQLNTVDERLRKVVEYRFFGGMMEKEIADVLGVSTRTVQRDWVKARAWLYDMLYTEAE
jgi:RNA polymerase sigma factor (TIGR02999 family)